jgi:predicted DNA binding CopG/RHH family protein
MLLISNAKIVMNIVMVQKIKLNGERCAQSARVFQDLKDRNLLNHIHQVAIADERDPTSIGYELAAQHQVDKAPFFVVTPNNGSTLIYTAYQRFLKEVLHQVPTDADEIAEIIAQNPDLDFV